MLYVINIDNYEWNLCGWRPFFWKLNQQLPRDEKFLPHFSPIPAQVPGSAQQALLARQLLPDWNKGMDSLKCEWVEHYHWEFYTTLPEDLCTGEKSVTLRAEGLDYSGWILIDHQEVAAFSGMLTAHEFPIGPYLKDGKTHRLSIIFDQPPQEQGQIGYTSRSCFFKPRFNYSWDWCPRFVPVGIWDHLHLIIGEPPLDINRIRTDLNLENRAGNIEIKITAPKPCDVRFEFGREGKSSRLQQTIPAGEHTVRWAVGEVEPWWPNGQGIPALYELKISVDGEILHQVQVGFKQVIWEPCAGAPDNALPWICNINGKKIFLQGVNWTPIWMNYPDVREEEYRQLIFLYKDMGCNVLRVWGGGFLEKEVFYQLCDEAGLLVWQEFPLSSSGIDNAAPDKPEVIEALQKIALSYIHRRGYHVSKLLWCGGNELHDAHGVPLDEDHPCLKALKNVVEIHDPGVRFLPTSPSGPSFLADQARFGLQVHHDVHGPWNTAGSLLEWEAYWKNDDALFRSEVGMPGISPLPLLDRYCGECSVWPPSRDNPYWRHVNAAWIPYDSILASLDKGTPRERLAQLVHVSQEFQAQALAIAVRESKARFPRCGGIIIWMGHDAFPCLANTSLIDFDRKPKPAYRALKEVFESEGRAMERPCDSVTTKEGRGLINVTR